MAKIKPGMIVRDKISGFEGVAIAVTDWLFGCVRVSVEPNSLDKDGKPRDRLTFDEPQLEIVGEHAVMEDDKAYRTRREESEAPPEQVRPPHGDRPDVERRDDPV